MQGYFSAINFGDSKLHNSNNEAVSNHHQTLNHTKQLFLRKTTGTKWHFSEITHVLLSHC